MNISDARRKTARYRSRFQKYNVPGWAQAEGLQLVDSSIHPAEHGKREACSLPAAIVCLHATPHHICLTHSLLLGSGVHASHALHALLHQEGMLTPIGQCLEQQDAR